MYPQHQPEGQKQQQPEGQKQQQPVQQQNQAPLYVPYEPTKIIPCFELRSRRELNTFDAVNSRLVNHWQTERYTPVTAICCSFWR